jgi:RHS repeat-associated protein
MYDGTSRAVHSACCFTGKERDTESGNDYFEARYYSSAMGRVAHP